MSKTIIDLDRDLVEDAKRALGGENVSIKDAVHEGLRRIVADAAHARVLDTFANLDDEQRDALLRARNEAW
jgi:Arc/MetJ family transcription regulator